MRQYKQKQVDAIKALEATMEVSEQVKQARAKAVRQLKDKRQMSLIDKARESEINSYLKLEEDYQSLVDHAQALERQLEEARDLLLQVQDHMSQLSSHTHDGWSGSCADTVYEMIENKLKEQG